MIKFLKYLRSLEPIDYYFLLFGKTLDCINPKFSVRPKSILFVCTGNICRSAYAKRKFSALVKDNKLSSLNIDSAGLNTEDGLKADHNAMITAKHRGIDLNPHRTKLATEERLDSYDLVLVMDSSHFYQINKKTRAKTKFLGCYGEVKRISVKDPYDKSEEIFNRCFDQIDQALEALIIELQKSA